MRRLAYDILNKQDNETFVWVETVRDFDSAKARVKELESTVGGEYVVFDQDALQTVSIKERSKREINQPANRCQIAIVQSESAPSQPLADSKKRAIGRHHVFTFTQGLEN